MSGSYETALNRIKEQLAARYPDRVITRTYRDFADRPAADLQKGIYTLLCRGIAGYNYEASDHFGLDGPNQTELGRVVIVISGQMKLPDKADGEAIDSAEFAMIRELERYADAGITDETLQDLLLHNVVMSQQLDAPYAWVFTEWHLRLFD